MLSFEFWKENNHKSVGGPTGHKGKQFKICEAVTTAPATSHSVARKASPAIAEIRNWNSSHTATTWRQFVWYNPNLWDTNDAAHGFILPGAVGRRSGSLPMGDPESKSVQIAGSATDCLMPHSMLQNQKSWQQWQLFCFFFAFRRGGGQEHGCRLAWGNQKHVTIARMKLKPPLCVSCLLRPLCPFVCCTEKYLFLDLLIGIKIKR